jgi:hypothetical protein
MSPDGQTMLSRQDSISPRLRTADDALFELMRVFYNPDLELLVNGSALG